MARFKIKYDPSLEESWCEHYKIIKSPKRTSLTVCNYLKNALSSLLTAERIWFKYDLYQRFIPPMNVWKFYIDLRPFSKYFNEPFSRTLRSPISNNLEIQNDENSTWKLFVKTADLIMSTWCLGFAVLVQNFSSLLKIS